MEHRPATAPHHRTRFSALSVRIRDQADPSTVVHLEKKLDMGTSKCISPENSIMDISKKRHRAGRLQGRDSEKCATRASAWGDCGSGSRTENIKPMINKVHPVQDRTRAHDKTDVYTAYMNDCEIVGDDTQVTKHCVPHMFFLTTNTCTWASNYLLFGSLCFILGEGSTNQLRTWMT